MESMHKISGELIGHEGLLKEDEIRLRSVQQSSEGGGLEGAANPPDV
jgi:hypothetical protein